MRNHTARDRTLWAAVALWLGASAAGLAGMAAYANRPGAPAHAPRVWPRDSRLTLDASRPTLVMFAHPKCDCTGASVAELAELMARAPHASRTYVVFMKPLAVDASWNETALWKAARAIPDVTVLGDDDGRETKRFGVETSGQSLLYAADGQLRFSGGATAARGHEGDNVGLQSMLAMLERRRPAATESSVFGCPLFASPLVLPGE
jgi:hypothetical protein